MGVKGSRVSSKPEGKSSRLSIRFGLDTGATREVPPPARTLAGGGEGVFLYVSDLNPHPLQKRKAQRVRHPQGQKLSVTEIWCSKRQTPELIQE